MKSIRSMSDERLEKELFAAQAPGNDPDAQRWFADLQQEEARRRVVAERKKADDTEGGSCD
jgi:hypothetical protein